VIGSFSLVFFSSKSFVPEQVAPNPNPAGKPITVTGDSENANVRNNERSVVVQSLRNIGLTIFGSY